MTDPAPKRAQPAEKTRYPLHRTLGTRWQDVDIYGHVNNVVYFSYFDTAINGWYLEAGLLDMPATDALFLVVENSAQYFAEIRFPQRVVAGIRVERLGTSSVTYDIGLFAGDATTACARGRYTHVLVDATTRRPVPIDGHRRAILETIS